MNIILPPKQTIFTIVRKNKSCMNYCVHGIGEQGISIAFQNITLMLEN